MKSIKILVLVVVSLLFVVVISGCTTKEERLGEFLFRQANNNASRVFSGAGFSRTGHTFDDWNVEVKKPIIKSVKTEKVMGVTMHYVKCKMEYQITSKKDGDTNYLVWYAKLVIEEDGFGEMVIHPSQTKELMLAAPEKEMVEKNEKRQGTSAREGKDLIS